MSYILLPPTNVLTFDTVNDAESAQNAIGGVIVLGGDTHKGELPRPGMPVLLFNDGATAVVGTLGYLSAPAAHPNNPLDLVHRSVPGWFVQHTGATTWTVLASYRWWRMAPEVQP